MFSRTRLLLCRNEQRHRRLDGIGAGKVPLVQRDAEAAARVNEDERLTDSDVGKGAHKWHGKRALAQSDAHLVAHFVTELLEQVTADVGDQVAEGPVQGKHLPSD